MKLDAQQEQVVNSTEPNILVVAGAGSGKTRVLTERVEHLINTGVEPQNIVCITFTNMASQEMKQRLGHIDCIGDAFIGTIHSFASVIYKGSQMEFQILNSEVELGIYQEILSRRAWKQKSKYTITFQKLLKYLDMQELCERGKINEEVLNGFLLPTEQHDMKELKKELFTICKQRNIITFTELLEKAEEYYESIGGRIEHVLVDEFQDVGKDEFRFISGLNADNTFYVGDDWQAIYGFKGGDVSIFLNLMESDKYKVYYLENNYRNGKNIVALAEKIIKQVRGKIDKEVRVMRTDIESDVIISTKPKIGTYMDIIKKKQNYKEWFILTRTNKEVVELSEMLEAKKIPYMSFKREGMSFDQMKELMNENTVKLLTVHVSKGLENKNVILYGNFPIVCPAYRLVEDERKVMYVGATRAEERLIILN